MDSIKTFPKFTIFFIVLMILEILGLTVIPSYHIVSKPMILAGLIGFYILEEKRQSHAFLTGLIFALLGDCFLLFGTSDMFMIGLIAFLIMQICYANTFNQKRRIPRTKDYIVPILIGVIGLGTLTFLWNSLGTMKWAVAIYTFAIVTMAIFAYLRHPKLRGYNILFLGVCLFIASDALLALNKFGDGFLYADIWVMLTYMLAQYCIVTGEVLGNRRVVKAKEPVSRFAQLREQKK
ncbi:MAG: lysoplasmalogenase [Saprospiraceae bacterium]|nr:lysoplasmalogenase [Saprospiraceae bacterium]